MYATLCDVYCAFAVRAGLWGLAVVPNPFVPLEYVFCPSFSSFSVFRENMRYYNADSRTRTRQHNNPYLDLYCWLINPSGADELREHWWRPGTEGLKMTSNFCNYSNPVFFRKTIIDGSDTSCEPSKLVALQIYKRIRALVLIISSCDTCFTTPLDTWNYDMYGQPWSDEQG